MHEGLTINEIAKSPKVTTKSFRASDYLSQQELDDLHVSNLRGKPIKKPYDDIDAFEAELLARFGWDTYQAWLAGNFETERALRFVAAERARDKQRIVNLEALIVSAVAGANNGDKNGHVPKSLRHAYKILQDELKKSQGEQ